MTFRKEWIGFKNRVLRGKIMGYTKEDEKELYFANAVLGAIKNVEVPMLMYEGEKKVVEKALREYINKLEAKARFGY